MNLDRKPLAAFAHADQYRALSTVFEAIGQYVLHHGCEQHRVGPNPMRARPQAQFNTCPTRSFGILSHHVGQKVPQVQGLKVGSTRPLSRV